MCGWRSGPADSSGTLEPTRVRGPGSWEERAWRTEAVHSLSCFRFLFPRRRVEIQPLGLGKNNRPGVTTSPDVTGMHFFRDPCSRLEDRAGVASQEAEIGRAGAVWFLQMDGLDFRTAREP